MLQYLSAQKENEREEKRNIVPAITPQITLKIFFNLHYPEINWWLNYSVTLYVKNMFDIFFLFLLPCFLRCKKKKGIGTKICLM